MNKIELFKMKCVILSFFVIGFAILSQDVYAKNELLDNGIPISQVIKEKVVTLNIKNRPIKEILYEIQKQSGVSFAFNEKEFGSELSNMSLTVKNVSVEKALEQLLASTNYTYKVVGNSVTIVKRPSQSVKEDKFSLKGKIIDGSTKRPLVGATVIVLGTSIGSITDETGTYAVQVSVGESIEISFVGMKSQVKKIDSQLKNLDITLELDQMNIDNVVVTGQANISRNSFTGNAKTIKGEDLLKISRTNVLKAIQNFDPSFKITENIQFGSDPNSLPDITIRGNSSLGTFEMDKDKLSKNNLQNNPNTPTFIMDGFEVSIQKVYDMDPNRILSMTILKDAAATAMYGSRAANGVVVITTIPPKDGKVRVSYNLTTTLEIPDLTDYNLMNATEKLEAERLAGVYEEEYGETDYYNYYKKWSLVHVEGVNTDWLALPLKTSFKHKHSLTVEGGTEALRYGFNMYYTSNNGVMKDSGRQNAGAELFLQFTFGNLNIRNSVSYATTWEEDSPYGSFSDFTHKSPYNRIKDAKGNYVTELQFSSGSDKRAKQNPLYEASLGNFSKRSTEQLINNLDIRWDVNEYFKVTGQLSLTKDWGKNDKFIDPLSINSTVLMSPAEMLTGDLYTGNSGSFGMDARFGVSYNRSVEKHNINFNVNGSLLQDKSNNYSVHYVGFPSGSLNSINYASAVEGKPISNESTSRSAGVTGILNYSYDNIYLADVSARYEGSSMFGENKKGSPFWSGGLGLNVHNYGFMQSATVISRLKVRGSYGQTGNINFPPYAAQNYYTTLFDDWYATGFGTKIEYLGNPDLKSETTHTVDVGIDMGFFDNRLSVVATYYNKTTKDMINDVTIPSSSGFSVYKDNLGKVCNKGYEFDVYANVIQKRDFSLTLNANLASNKNTLLEIAESLKNYNERVDGIYDLANTEGIYSKSEPFRKYEEGGSMTSLFGMQSLGIDPQTGQEVFMDRAGNIVYNWSASQQRILGNTESKAQGAFGVNVRYKNLTFFASFSYQFGGQTYNQTLVDNVENADISNNNVDKRVLTDRWQKPGDVTPLKDIKDTKVTYPSSRFVQDYNVLSLNSLSLQYEFGNNIVKKLHLERLLLEAKCNEVFRLSSVKQERGLSYPFARSFELSLVVNF